MMKKIIIGVALVIFGINGFANNDSLIHIIPQPVSVAAGAGTFYLNAATVITVNDTALRGIADLLSGFLNGPSGYGIPVKKAGAQTSNVILMERNRTPDSKILKNGYKLLVTPQRIRLTANEPEGLFYGIQTLLQLMPPDIESRGVVRKLRWPVPCVAILDYPRFHYRGLMLDVSRHFFTKAEVKKYIDEMVKYKFNVFHWHLTDDQGWRIQLDGLPELTGTGAWSVPRTGRFGEFAPPQPGEKATYGGFYSQKDIREIIDYARKRFITIVPEIDVPAHSLSMIASYPALSCTQQQYPVNPGSPMYGKIDNVLCVNNDSTWLILDKVFTEVARLFPGPYIHIGGDEANKSFWNACPKDQALMKANGLKHVDELQHFFMKKLERLITSKGKKMVGWDEVLEGGTLPSNVIISARMGIDGCIAAAKAGHPVIMIPWEYTYLDLSQGDPLIEPATYGQIRLKRSYGWNPVPNGVNPDQVLGGEGVLWTESVPDYRQAEYMTWPRSLALAEAFWSPQEQLVWNDFVRRMEARFRYMDAGQVKYARSAYDPVITGVKDANDSLLVNLETEIDGLELHYQFNGTNPDQFSPRYKGTPLNIPKGATEIRVITYRNGAPVGKQINCPLSEIRKRVP
ncbi:family 20 glycosylhydrolase [Niabella sp. CC-SYL272]|uniref:beta-N-acetylhexosaminidase n=1 Tax=Niabella agricola TaxID=2891571 RepID=UPI001F1C2A00|nr:family 20 glycosylhydrolase [Niabella agricola]MCF3108672.1 family 20 glycosylhydrolase [Niabella agricola]